MRTGATAILLFAALSRLLRAGGRWEEWALHFAAYNNATTAELLAGDTVGALSTWVGLHPPLYPFLHGLGTLVLPMPAIWLIFSSACSLGAVWFMLRAHPSTLLPALLLATDPVQLHYAAEVNNYPLSVLVIAATWWALRSNRIVALTVFVVIGAWTHILAGLVCILIALTHPKRMRILMVAAFGVMPLVPNAWALAVSSASQRQPPLDVERSIQDAIDRFSVLWVMLIPMILLGAQEAKAAAFVWASTLAIWAGMVGVGIAAPHQFPYAMLLGVPAVVLLSATASRHLAFGVIIVIAAIGRGLVGLGSGLADTWHIVANQSVHRGIDAVLDLSLPGDAIVLVRGPGPPDDDRRHHSPVLWRLSPFDDWNPIFTKARPDLVGQPWLHRGRRIYTFSHPRPSLAIIPGRHVFTVLYDGAEQNPMSIPDHPLQGDWKKAGPDLWRGPIDPSQTSGAAATSGGEESDGSPPGPPEPG
jgi:hypothetical protein